MKSRTEKVLSILYVLSWIVYVGLAIEAGSLIISYIVSIGNPDGAKHLYKGMDLFLLRQYSFQQYTIHVALLVAFLIMKAQVAYLVIKVLGKIKLSNPFVMETVRSLEQISYLILGTWMASVIHNIHAEWLEHRVGELSSAHISGEFLFFAGVVFVLSQIFKKGVEIQTENELTI